MGQKVGFSALRQLFHAASCTQAFTLHFKQTITTLLSATHTVVNLKTHFKNICSLSSAFHQSFNLTN